MASVRVHIDNVIHPKSPGETIKGHIKSSFSARIISAALIGVEKSRVTECDGLPIEKTSCFLDVPVLLDVQLDVSQGMHRMHFEVQLPDKKLYASTSFVPQMPVEHCVIAYCVMARVVESATGIVYHAKTESQVIDVTALAVDPVPFYYAPTTETITGLFCQSRGCIMIGARMPDTLLDKSNAVEVYVSARNFSNARIVRGWLSLHENIRWRAGMFSSQRSVCLSRLAMDLSFPGLEPTMPRQLQHQTELQAEIQREMESTAHCYKLQIPESANNDFKGALIQCDHTICICLETRAGSTNVKVEFPVQIGFWARKEKNN